MEQFAQHVKGGVGSHWSLVVDGRIADSTDRRHFLDYFRVHNFGETGIADFSGEIVAVRRPEVFQLIEVLNDFFDHSSGIKARSLRVGLQV